MASKKELNKTYYEQHKKDIAEQRKIKREQEKELIKQAINQTPQTQTPQTQTPENQTPQTQTQHVSGSYQTDKVRVLPVDVVAYLKTVTEEYLDNNKNLERVERQFSKRLSKYILAYNGESGIGKTLLVKYYASKNKIPIVVLTCSNQTNKYNIFGTQQAKDNESVFVLGVVPTVIELANKSPMKKAILLIDEVSALTPETQKLLNENLNFREGVTVTEINQNFRLNDDSTIAILATKNPSSYAGTNELNRELDSRVLTVNLKDLTVEETIELLERYKIKEDLIKKLCNLKDQVNAGYDSGSLYFRLDTREIVKFVSVYTEVLESENEETAIKEAASLVLGKYSIVKENQTLVAEMVESIFGVDI